MKIALVSPYDFAFPGGVCNHISCLEHRLTQMGHLVKIIAPVSHAVTSFENRFIPIGKPRPVPASGSICRVTISPWLSSQIKAVFDAEKFDIVHLHEPLMPMLCTTALRLSNTATVGTFHATGGRPGYDFGKPLTTILLKKWYRRLHGKIAVSPPARDFVHRYFPGYYDIIPNGVDTDHFSPSVSPLEEYCDGKMNILFVGRLETRKGFNYLLDAYQSVKREVPNCRLIVVGPGTRLRHRYEKRARRRKIEDVIFVGPVSYKELPRYYKTADIYCSPATGAESFGVVLLEAMATGKPIVASNISGYASVLTHGGEGLLVPPRDRQALAQALITLIGNEPLRQQMGERGLATAADYSWERVSRQVYNYYVRVLSEPPWEKKFPTIEAMSLTPSK
ncbi:glycosyltransferase family 4 protein [Chloroflexota bacterium]